MYKEIQKERFLNGVLLDQKVVGYKKKEIPEAFIVNSEALPEGYLTDNPEEIISLYLTNENLEELANNTSGVLLNLEHQADQVIGCVNNNVVRNGDKIEGGVIIYSQYKDKVQNISNSFTNSNSDVIPVSYEYRFNLKYEPHLLNGCKYDFRILSIKPTAMALVENPRFTNAGLDKSTMINSNNLNDNTMINLFKNKEEKAVLNSSYDEKDEMKKEKKDEMKNEYKEEKEEKDEMKNFMKNMNSTLINMNTSIESIKNSLDEKMKNEYKEEKEEKDEMKNTIDGMKNSMTDFGSPFSNYASQSNYIFDNNKGFDEIK